MSMKWWNRRERKPARVPQKRKSVWSGLSFLTLEDRTVPAITINSLNLTPPGPINEGAQSTLNINYTATNVIGTLQLQINTSAPISFTQPTLTPGMNLNAAVPITFLDNNTPPNTPVDMSVSIIDTGPGQITNSADGGGYRAFTVPFTTNVGLNASLNALGVNTGVQTLFTSNPTNDNQNGQISLGGNTFQFYGASVGTQIGVNENGLITINGLAPSTANNNTQLQSLGNNLGAIAPMWTDLVLSPTGRVCFRFVDLDGNAANLAEYLVIEWANVLHRTPGGGVSTQPGTFQVFLQLNTGTGVNGDVIFNYVDTDFGSPTYNFGASATVGIKNINSSAMNLTQLAFNPGPNNPIINNFQDLHSVRFTSNAISLPSAFGPTDASGYRGFRSPFEANVNLVNANFNGQATNVILTGTFDNNSGFQSGPQSLLSTITVPGNSPTVNNNTFNFYGTQFTNLSVSKNGYISLGGAAQNNTQNNPNSLVSTPITAALSTLWDNWNGLAGAGAQILGRFIDFDGNGVPEYLVINWKGVNNGGINPTTPENFATFQTILQLNTGTSAGAIYFNYMDTDVGDPTLNNGASATVGIKAANPTNGNFLDIYVDTTTNDLQSRRALGVFQIGSASQDISIQVNNVAPVLSANPNDDLTVDEGSTFTRTIFITDPGVLDTFTGTISFGDGSPDEAIGVFPGGTTSFVMSHIYADNGAYTVTINLVDKDGGVAIPFMFTVTVDNVPPTLTTAPGPRLLFPGQVLILDGSSPANPFLGTFTDPGFTPPFGTTMETFTTTVDWGDGFVETVPPNTTTVIQTVVNGSPGVDTTGTIAGRHSYSTAGRFTITVTVVDDDGGTAIGTIMIEIGSANVYAVAADAGGGPIVKVFDSRLNVLSNEFNAYNPLFTGGVRVGAGDVNGDGLADVVTAPGAGGGPHIKVFDGFSNFTSLVREFLAYDPAFLGGVYVGVGDMNGDGIVDIATGAGQGGGPHVKVFSGADNALLFDGFAYSATFRGGVRVAIADVNGDGRGDLITGAGPTGSSHVIAFSGLDGSIISSFFAYDTAYTGGIYVAAADFNGDGRAEIVTGPDQGGGPHLRVFDLATGLIYGEINAFPPGIPGSGQFTGDTQWSSGLRVGIVDFNQDQQPDIIVGPGAGKTSRVKIFNGANLTQSFEALEFSPLFLGGIFVGGN